MHILENDALRISFTAEGTLAEFYQKTIGRDYIAQDRAGQRPLFRLLCCEMEDERVLPGTIPFSSRLAQEVHVKRHSSELELHFANLDGLDIHVYCTIRLEEGPFSYWSIRVENNSRYGLATIEYPIVHARPVLSPSGYEDRILLPKQDGYLLGNPQVYPWQGDFPFRRVDQRFQYPGEGREFPASLCAQLLAYYDTAGGLYVATHDGEGHPKRLGPVQTGQGENKALDFTPEHQLPQRRGGGYSAPYETVLACFHGDWRDAADIYKTWSVKQAWCAKTLAQRTDVPEWVKRGAFFFCFRLRGQPGGTAYLREVPAYLERWQAFLGLPLVAMMCGWEKHGEWMGPDYFPPYGEAGFAALCAMLKARGIRPFPFGLSGFKLPIRKKIGGDWPQPELAVDYDNRAAFEREYRAHAALDADGHLITDSPVASWDGLHAYACVATPQAEAQLCGASQTLVEVYGVQVNQADQVFGGGVTECYTPGHGHLPGRGRWQVEVLRSLYQKTRRDGKQADPDFALSQEFPSELYLQHLDVCHGRVYDQPRGIEGVPLFAYLYHEYLACYGGDWVSMLPENRCGVYTQAANFVYGSLPAGCPQNMRESMRNASVEECDEDILAMARNTCALFARLPQYLALGKMCKSPQLNVPRIQVEFSGMDFSGWEKGPMPMPAVLHTLWQAPDGTRAWALANISARRQAFEIPLRGRGAAQPLLWVNDREPMILSHESGVVSLALAPLEAAILEER